MFDTCSKYLAVLLGIIDVIMHVLTTARLYATKLQSYVQHCASVMGTLSKPAELNMQSLSHILGSASSLLS